MLFFTSDTHFGHKTICELARRPFPSVDAMNAAIIGNWNAAIGADDEVWHLGDFAFLNRGDAQAVLDRLPGRKHLVAGNHDKLGRKLSGWQSVHDYVELKTGGRKIVLCHYPLATWNAAHHGRLHLHGHCHGNFPDSSLRLDVGVDVWWFEPTTLALIDQRRATLPGWKPVDHHVPD